MRRVLVLSALILALFWGVVFVEPAVADWWSISGRIVDDVTGQPAAGMRYAVYSWDPIVKELTLESDGTVKDSGRFKASVFSGRPWAVVYVGSSLLYHDMWHRSEIIPDKPSYWSPSTLPLRGAAADATRFKKGSSFGDIRVKARPQPYGALSGRVYDAYTGGHVIMRLTVWQWDSNRAEWTAVQESDYGSDYGYYAYIGSSSVDLTKEFRLSFSKPYSEPDQVAFFPYGNSVEEAPSLRLRPGEVLYGVDLPVYIGNRLRGSVIRTEDKSGMENVVMRGHRYDAATDTWSGRYYERTNESGYYCSMVLRPGRYRISAWDRYESGKTVYYGQGSSLGSAWDVEIERGDVHSDLDIWLSDSSAVAGTVVDSTGRKRSDVRVTAFEYNDGVWTNRGTDYTDANGRCRVMVPPGSYTLRFTDCGGTAGSGDDISFFLGGYSDIDEAKRTTVYSKRTRAVRIFSIDAPEASRGDRIYGGSTCGSAVHASREAFGADEATQVVLAAGAKADDALVAAGLAGAVEGPVLLTNSGSAYRPMLVELKRLGAKKVYIVGNTKSVSNRQYQLLRAMGYRVERLSGANAYEVSARVMRRIDAISGIEATTPVYLVSGRSRTDALIVGPAAYANKSPVLLVNPKTYAQRPAVSVTKSLKVRRVYAVGDYKTLPTRALRSLRSNGVAVSRVATSTSVYSRAAKFATVAEQRDWLEPTRIGLASTTALGDALASPSALGRTQGALLFAKPTELTSTTKRAITSRGARIEKIKAYARPSALRSRVLLEAGGR